MLRVISTREHLEGSVKPEQEFELTEKNKVEWPKVFQNGKEWPIGWITEEVKKELYNEFRDDPALMSYAKDRFVTSFCDAKSHDPELGARMFAELEKVRGGK